MARTPLTVIAPLGPYPTLPPTALSLDFVLTALTGSSGSNGNQVAFGNYNRLMLVFQNSGVAGRTFTITSVANSNVLNRSGDISAYAIGAGLFSVIFIERNGFIQTDGNLYFEANHAEVKCAVFGIS